MKRIRFIFISAVLIAGITAFSLNAQPGPGQDAEIQAAIQAIMESDATEQEKMEALVQLLMNVSVTGDRQRINAASRAIARAARAAGPGFADGLRARLESEAETAPPGQAPAFQSAARAIVQATTAGLGPRGVAPPPADEPFTETDQDQAEKQPEPVTPV